MKNFIYLVIPVAILSGCQSMGEHFTCLDEANRITRTEQRYVRTETKCVEGRTAFGVPSGSVNCTSTPIYEAVILNQSERDSVYQNCRNRVSNQKQFNTSITTNSSKLQPTSGYCRSLLMNNDVNSYTYRSQCQ